ncbi:hypothetical protein [Erythrobacter alti]|uniref:hypothetical protein n=1 Tax=Erythrobacter alti TaxID=1896145 RepID=UPI0030F4380B
MGGIGMAEATRKDYGALVGWTSTNTGGRVALHLQSVTKPPPHTSDDVQTQIYLLDRNQAMQLANFLFEVGETSTPERRDRSWIKRMFG